VFQCMWSLILVHNAVCLGEGCFSGCSQACYWNVVATTGLWSRNHKTTVSDETILCSPSVIHHSLRKSSCFNSDLNNFYNLQCQHEAIENFVNNNTDKVGTILDCVGDVKEVNRVGLCDENSNIQGK